MESYFLSVQRALFKNSLLDVAYVGNHGVKLQGFLNANQKNPSLGFARPYANWPSDITEALNEFYSNYNSLQVKYEQRLPAGLTLLNSFTWEHSLDNASASLEGNTPSPQDGNNIRARLCAVGLQPADRQHHQPGLRAARSGTGGTSCRTTTRLVDGVLGGWQVSAINTAQAGTPFNITYAPNSAQAVSPQISATYRGANEYRPNRVAGQSMTQGTGEPGGQHGLCQLRQLQRVRPAADQGRGRQCAEPVRQRQPQPRPHAGFLPDRPCAEQEVRDAGRGPEGRVPHGVLQHLQPHQPVPAGHDQRHARHHDPDAVYGCCRSHLRHHRRYTQRGRADYQYLYSTRHSIWIEGTFLSTVPLQIVCRPSSGGTRFCFCYRF